MSSPLAEDWTHTAIVLVLHAEETTRHLTGSIHHAVEEVLASPEFDEVSVHLVLSTSGKHTILPSLDDVLLKVTAGTEAPTISLVWCTDDGVEDTPLSRDLDALHAVRADFPSFGTLEFDSHSTNVPTAIREIVIGALEAADGAAGVPRGTIEEAIVGSHQPTPESTEHPARAASDGGMRLAPSSVYGASDLASPAVLHTDVGPSLQLSGHETLDSPSSFDARTEQFELAGDGSDLNLGDQTADHNGPFTPGERDSRHFQPRAPNYGVDVMGSTGDGFQPFFDDTGSGAADNSDARTDSSVWGSSLDAENHAVLPGSMPLPYAQPESEGSRWFPPVVQNVVSSVTSHVDGWRARTKMRRAEEQIGVSALEQLPVYSGVRRPLIYFGLAASTGWDKQAVRTRDAALTLLSDALDHNWIAVAFNLGSTLTRVGGPASPKSIAQDWRRIERNNDFDLGVTAEELSRQFSRDSASLRLRGHEVDPPHVVILATEPPYVDSVASSAYRTLLGEVRSVSWLIVGDSDWMDFPPELDERPSRVLYAEQDGVAILLSEVLGPPEVIPSQHADM